MKNLTCTHDNLLETWFSLLISSSCSELFCSYMFIGMKFLTSTKAYYLVTLFILVSFSFREKLNNFIFLIVTQIIPYK